MKTVVCSLCCVICGISPAHPQADGGKKPPPVDYQAKADQAKWEFAPAAASLKRSMDAFPKGYQVATDVNDFGTGAIRIKKDDKLLYSWEGHDKSVFLALG